MATATTAIEPNVKISATKLLINGQWVSSTSGKTFPTINPSTGEVITQVAEADAPDVDKAVSAARAAFETGAWRKKLSASQRGALMYKLADLIEKNADELAQLEALDNGKPYHVARAADLPLTIACYRYYAGWADKNQGKTIPVNGPYFTYTKHEPVGVAGQIIPWNFPLLMQAWKLGPALAAGCTVVLKPAEQTPLTALRSNSAARVPTSSSPTPTWTKPSKAHTSRSSSIKASAAAPVRVSTWKKKPTMNSSRKAPRAPRSAPSAIPSTKIPSKARKSIRTSSTK